MLWCRVARTSMQDVHSYWSGVSGMILTTMRFSQSSTALPRSRISQPKTSSRPAV